MGKGLSVMSRDKNIDGRFSIRDYIFRALDIYNKYRFPEAHAELVSIDDGKVIIKFTGSFCHTCGVRDWVEDFKYVLEDLGIKAELVEYREPIVGSDYRIGVFRIKGVGEKGSGK